MTLASRNLLALSALALLSSPACIAPQNYHPKISTFQYDFAQTSDGYFQKSHAFAAFIEFNEQGKLFSTKQVEDAVSLIATLQHPDGNPSSPEQPILLLAFIHGWKNNASESCGNVWGFRRTLNQVAALEAKMPHPRPIVGLYIGWPGDSAVIFKNATFANRQAVANKIGHGELAGTLKRILVQTKGPKFDGPSQAVLVGHSFGGLVMEGAAIALLEEVLPALKTSSDAVVYPPADLIVLLNEAGPAAQAKPFLQKFLDQNIIYEDAEHRQYPLLISLTSTGDVATKFAFPGGQFITPHRPPKETYNPPDAFGLTSNTPYILLTAANTVALQSHDIILKEDIGSEDIVDVIIPGIDNHTYLATRRPDRKNNTPYWIMQMPQIFVPDHSTIFRSEFQSLLIAFLEHQGMMTTPHRLTPAEAAAPIAKVVPRAAGRLAMRKAAM